MAAPQSLSVAVLSASPAFRTRLRQFLEGHQDVELRAVAGELPGLLERVGSAPLDWILVHPDGDSPAPADALRHLRRVAPRAKVLVLLEPGPNTELAAFDWTLGSVAGVLVSEDHKAGIARLERWFQGVLLPALRGDRGAGQDHPRPPLPATPATSPAPQEPVLRTHGPVSAVRPEILAVAASTGGPAALTEFFSHLPADFPLPVVVVQHMPAHFTKLFAQRLNERLPLGFAEARGGEDVVAGQVYIAPGEHHLIVEREGDGPVRTALDDGPPECSCKPAADVLFRSVARVYGARTIAVVLTGMGQDGYAGVQPLVNLGVRVFAQDEASSVVWGMPGKIVTSGLASFVGTPTQIAMEVLRQVALVGARRG